MFLNRTCKVLCNLILLAVLCTGQVSAAPDHGRQVSVSPAINEQSDTVHSISADLEQSDALQSEDDCFSETPGKSEECEQYKTVHLTSDKDVSGSPLSFTVNPDTSTAIYFNGVKQFFGEHAEGVFLWVGNKVYGPGSLPAGLRTYAYTPISKVVSGLGTTADPWKIITVVDVGSEGLRLTQTVKYINGEAKLSYSWQIRNNGLLQKSYTLFHAADLYTANVDLGYGYYDPHTGAVGGYTRDYKFYQYFQPITPGSFYFEGFYKNVWEKIGSISGQGSGFGKSEYLPDDYLDNGAGLQWKKRTVAVYSTDTISDIVVFNSATVPVTCHTLTITPSENGSITPRTEHSSPCQNGQYLEGTTVKLQAEPIAPYQISDWSGVDGTLENKKYATVIMNSDRTVTATFNSKPVIVLVHGILTINFSWSDTCESTAYHYSDSPDSTSGGDKNLREYFATLPGELKDNYDVWIAHVESGPLGTPSLYQNAACLGKQIKDIGTYSGDNLKPPRKVMIIAHSMGGLISRACTSQNLNGCRDYVHSLMTLGSPHSGMKWWEIYGQIALQDMQPGKMVEFNVGNKNTNSLIKYVFLGGGGKGPWGRFGVYYGSNYGDEVVSDVSSIGWTNTQGAIDPEDWDTVSCINSNQSCQTQPSRLWTDNKHDNYFSSGSPALKCISWFLGGGVQPSECSTAGIYQTHASVQNTSNIQTTPMIENTLAPAGSVNHTVQVDTGGNTNFILFWSGGDPTFSLTQPDGQTIDPVYAAAHPELVTYSNQPGGGMTLNQRVYTFANASAGAWQMEVTNEGTESSHTYAFAQLTSTRALTVSTSADTVSPGDSLTITANVTNGTTGIPGAAVSAALTRADGVRDSLSFTDRGNGTYTAIYSVPNAPGYLTLSVTAAGSDGGVLFERQAVQTLDIRSTAARFSHEYSDSAVDNDSNGKYDSLDVQVGVNVTTSANFLLTGDLTSNGQYVAHAGTQTELISGVQSPVLSFSGDEIRTSGLNGPYTLTNLTLTDLALGSIPLDSASNVWTTPAYNAADFADTCFELDLAIDPGVGGSVSADPAPNCGGIQYTPGSVVNVTATANTGHVFTNWIGDASGTNATTSVTMDTDKLVMAVFTPQCYSLTLSSNPAWGGNVTPDITPNCNGNTQYIYGSVVQLTADPNDGYEFSNWSGNASGSTSPTLVTIISDKVVTANFGITAPSMISLQRSDPDISGEVNLDLVLSVAGIEPGVSGADVYVSYDPAFVAPPTAPGVRTAEALPDFFGSTNVSINELLPAAQCPGGASPCIHLVLAGPPQSTQTGIAARYHFRGVAEGTACFAVLQSTLVNADGYPVQHAGVPQECVPVELSATASGVVNRQGIVVAAGAGAAGNGPVCSSVTAIGNETFGPTHTDAGGGYNFINLPVGTYLFRAAYPGYLTSEKNGVNVSTNVPAIDAGATTLRGGDVNGDNAINILDVATILSKFGLSGVAVRSASADCSGPDEAFDINDDGLINVSDLAITAGNWGKVGPTAWQP